MRINGVKPWISQRVPQIITIACFVLFIVALYFVVPTLIRSTVNWLLTLSTHPIAGLREPVIQVGGHVIQIFILLVLALTLIAIWLSMRTQQKLAAAELLRDRYDMFFKSWEVSDEDVKQFRNKVCLFVEIDKIDKEYLQYLLREDTKESAIKKYLLIVQLYEYLAFAHALTSSTKYLGRWWTGNFWEKRRNKYLDRLLIANYGERSCNRTKDNYFDPYGEQWLKRWVKILIDDPDFPHVHQSYEKDHPEFYRFIEDEIKEIMLTERIVELKDSGYCEQEIVDRLAGDGIVDRHNQPVTLSSMRRRYNDYKRNIAATLGGSRLPSPYDYISWKS